MELFLKINELIASERDKVIQKFFQNTNIDFQQNSDQFIQFLNKVANLHKKAFPVAFAVSRTNEDQEDEQFEDSVDIDVFMTMKLPIFLRQFY